MFSFLSEVEPCLLHPSAEHLIGGDEHDTDDKCDGEGTNQAFAHTRVFFLLCWARCGKIQNHGLEVRGGGWGGGVCEKVQREVAELTVNVHVTLRAVQVVLLCHDDVLDVFHSQVVAESVVQQPLQLIHRQFLHVALRRRQINHCEYRAEGGSEG